MARNEVTGKSAGTAASKTMRNLKATEPEKSAAASALTQRPDRSGTSKRAGKARKSSAPRK